MVGRTRRPPRNTDPPVPCGPVPYGTFAHPTHTVLNVVTSHMCTLLSVPRHDEPAAKAAAQPVLGLQASAVQLQPSLHSTAIAV